MSESSVSKRKFFMHSAHETIGISAGLAAFKACNPARFATAASAKRRLGVCIVSEAPIHETDELLTILREHVEKCCNCRCTTNLEESDCLLLVGRWPAIGGKQLDRIKRYCRRGGAVLGVRTAGGASENCPELDNELFGCDYHGCYQNEFTEVEIAEGAASHPILSGVGPFRSHGTLQKNPNIAEGCKVLLTGGFAGHVQPVAWTRRPHGARVFYTSLGVPDDFRNPDFIRLLAGAVCWAGVFTGD